MQEKISPGFSLPLGIIVDFHSGFSSVFGWILTQACGAYPLPPHLWLGSSHRGLGPGSEELAGHG